MSIADVLDGKARYHVEHSEALTVLRSMPSDSVDAVVTDPPAGIAFMGKDWDGHKGGRLAWVAWRRAATKAPRTIAALIILLLAGYARADAPAAAHAVVVESATPPAVATNPLLPLVPAIAPSVLTRAQQGLAVADATLHAAQAILGVPSVSTVLPAKFWDTTAGHAVAVVFAVASLAVPLSGVVVGAIVALR